MNNIEKKTAYILVMMYPSKKEQYREQANLDGKTLSEYIRTLLEKDAARLLGK